jgi:hypothetical protein
MAGALGATGACGAIGARGAIGGLGTIAGALGATKGLGTKAGGFGKKTGGLGTKRGATWTTPGTKSSKSKIPNPTIGTMVTIAGTSISTICCTVPGISETSITVTIGLISPGTALTLNGMPCKDRIRCNSTVSLKVKKLTLTGSTLGVISNRSANVKLLNVNGSISAKDGSSPKPKPGNAPSMSTVVVTTGGTAAVAPPAVANKPKTAITTARDKMVMNLKVRCALITNLLLLR